MERFVGGGMANAKKVGIDDAEDLTVDLLGLYWGRVWPGFRDAGPRPRIVSPTQILWWLVRRRGGLVRFGDDRH